MKKENPGIDIYTGNEAKAWRMIGCEYRMRTRNRMQKYTDFVQTLEKCFGNYNNNNVMNVGVDTNQVNGLAFKVSTSPALKWMETTKRNSKGTDNQKISQEKENILFGIPDVSFAGGKLSSLVGSFETVSQFLQKMRKQQQTLAQQLESHQSSWRLIPDGIPSPSNIFSPIGNPPTVFPPNSTIIPSIIREGWPIENLDQHSYTKKPSENTADQSTLVY